MMTRPAEFLFALCFSAAAGAEPRTFYIDGNRSTASARVGKTGIASFAGHDHTVAARVIQGEVVFDPAALSSSSVDLIVSTRSLVVSEKGEPEGDAPKVQDAMRSPGVLDVARFPTIHFRSTQVSGRQTARDSYELTLQGALSLHGVEKMFSVPVRLTVRGDTLAAAGKLSVKQTDFGIEPTSAAGGLVRVEDDVSLTFDIAARSTGR